MCRCALVIAAGSTAVAVIGEPKCRSTTFWLPNSGAGSAAPLRFMITKVLSALRHTSRVIVKDLGPVGTLFLRDHALTRAVPPEQRGAGQRQSYLPSGLPRITEAIRR
jgi:hypothetical protein